MIVRKLQYLDEVERGLGLTDVLGQSDPPLGSAVDRNSNSTTGGEGGAPGLARPKPPDSPPA